MYQLKGVQVSLTPPSLTSGSTKNAIFDNARVEDDAGIDKKGPK